MAVDPNPSIWNSDDSQEVSAINYGLGDAGTYLLLEAGTEYHVWNDKGMVKGSSKMTTVKVSARDDNGDEVKNITKQLWVEIKSLTIHEGDEGDASGETDDNMTEFQPVGLNAPLSIGDIPADCYRKIMVRVHLPNSAIEGPVTFQIYVINQEPSTPIAKWITGLFGNGVVYLGNKIEVTDNEGANSKVDVNSGFALINNMEVIVTVQVYTLPTNDDIYKLYLTQTGVISYTTGTIPSNSIQLATVVISSGVVDSVTDKRTFIFHTFSRVIPQHFQDLLPANTGGIHTAITGTGEEQNITENITNPDYARNTSITTTSVASPSGNVTITGLVRGTEDTDVIAIIPGETAYGVKAFDVVTNINIPAGVSGQDTVTVGFSDKIGLSKPITSAADVFKKKVNTEDKTSELSGKVSTVYHTVDCETIENYEDMELRYKSVLTI